MDRAGIDVCEQQDRRFTRGAVIKVNQSVGRSFYGRSLHGRAAPIIRRERKLLTPTSCWAGARFGSIVGYR